MGAKITGLRPRNTTALREMLYSIDGAILSILNEYKTTKANPNPTITPKEISILWNCHVETVRQIQSGVGRLTAQRYAALAQAVASRGDYRLAELVLPSNMLLYPKPSVRLNGRLEEESLDLHCTFGAACTMFQAGKYSEAKQHIFAALEAVQQAAAEIHERI